MTLNARMTVTAAIAVVLASTVLYPLFTDSVFLVVSMGAVITVAGTGALTRLRSLPVPICVLATLVGLLLYLNLVFEAPRSWAFVIPTPGSLSRLWQLAGTGLTDANKYAPPAPNLASLLLLVGAGVGITAVATDLIAVRLRSTALAGLPLLVLFTVPVMMNAPHSQLTTPLVFCAGGAGYLAMLSADGRERIRVWGHLVSLWRPARRAGEARSGPDTRTLAAAGRRVGLASIVLALCAPLLIPGLHPSKVFSSGPGIGGDGDGSVGALILPTALSGTITQLHENPQVVFTYQTTASKSLQDNDAQYLRQYAFDTLGPSGFEVSAYTQDTTPSTSMPAAPGLTDMSAATPVRTSVTVGKDFPDVGNQPTFLPMPYPASKVAVPGRWLADSELMVYSTVSAISGQSYSVSSYAVDPSQTQLERVPALAKTPALDADTQLPASYQSSALKKLAQSHTAGATTEYAKVNDLASWLSLPPYVYSISASTFDNAAGLLSFLTTTRVGYCVQYAYAMTVLTRLLGIPARFVVGYTAGMLVKSGSSTSTYQVKNTDAHAWTEVYFPTYGWIRFEPTPGGQGTASTPNYMGGGTSGTGSRLNTDPIIQATGNAVPKTPGGPTNRFNNGRLGPGETGGAAASGKSAGTPWAAVVVAVIAAIVLATGVISMVAPPAQRILSAHPAEAARRRRPVGSVILVAAAAALFALALYRLLSHTSGLSLGAGWATVGIAFGAAGAVALVAPSLIRVMFRRWRWLRATDDVSRAHAAWHEFHDDLADFGIRSRPSEPPRTLARRVTAGLPEPAGEAVRRLALAEERARYAAQPAESRDLRRDGTAARRGLAAAAGRASRWRAYLFPASLLTAMADGAVRLPDRIGARMTRRRAAGKAAR